MKRRLIAWGRGRPARRLLGHAALLALGLMLACAKKDKEVICTETCCSANKTRYKYITELKNEEAAYNNRGFRLKRGQLLDDVVDGVLVCEMSLGLVSNLPTTSNPNDIPNLPFAYRISGTVYQHLDIFTINGDPVYFIRLDSVK